MTIAIVNSKGSVGKTTVALNLAHALQRDGHATQLIDLDDGQNDLKANQNFQELQGQLEETETRISQSRRFYNANVRELNTSVESFPNSLIAGNFGFKSEQYFEIDEPFARAGSSAFLRIDLLQKSEMVSFRPKRSEMEKSLALQNDKISRLRLRLRSK